MLCADGPRQQYFAARIGECSPAISLVSNCPLIGANMPPQLGQVVSLASISKVAPLLYFGSHNRP